MVSELMDTDLHQLHYSRKTLTAANEQEIIYQIFCALKYIHSAKVFHRNMSPVNILLNAVSTGC